jgi:hypothetical protein
VRGLCMQRPVRAGVSNGQRGDGEDSRNGGRERASTTSDDPFQAVIFHGATS